MTGSRTLYRLKRIELIGNMIIMLANMLTWYKRDLEHLNLPLLKKISKDIEILLYTNKDFRPHSKNNDSI